MYPPTWSAPNSGYKHESTDCVRKHDLWWFLGMNCNLLTHSASRFRDASKVQNFGTKYRRAISGYWRECPNSFHQHKKRSVAEAYESCAADTRTQDIKTWGSRQPLKGLNTSEVLVLLSHNSVHRGGHTENCRKVWVFPFCIPHAVPGSFLVQVRKLSIHNYM
jgi:hypothetical protein